MAHQQLLPNSIVALASSGLVLGGTAGPDVGEKKRAGLLVAVALWSLRERHAVNLRSSEYGRWWSFGPAFELTVDIAGSDVSSPEIQPNAPFRGPQFSLEQELLNQARMIAALSIADSTTLLDIPMHRALNNNELARITRRVMDGWRKRQARARGPHQREEPRVKVGDVINDWLGDDFANPHREVIDRVTDHAKTAGCLETALIPRGNPVTRFLFGPRVVNFPSPARASELERAAQSLAGEWQRFLREESALSSWLMATVMDAIRARTLHRDID